MRMCACVVCVVVVVCLCVVYTHATHRTRSLGFLHIDDYTLTGWFSALVNFANIFVIYAWFVEVPHDAPPPSEKQNGACVVAGRVCVCGCVSAPPCVFDVCGHIAVCVCVCVSAPLCVT